MDTPTRREIRAALTKHGPLTCRELAEQPSELVMGPVRPSLTAYFARQEVDARKKAAAALDSPRYLALLRALDKLLVEPPLTHKATRKARPELKHPILRAARRLKRAVDALAAASDRNAALHEVRKMAKQAARKRSPRIRT